MTSSASVAARVAGVVGALGYLTGAVDGPVLGVLAGLALLTFGRALASTSGAELIPPASFGVLAGAIGVVALRWGTLDLQGIDGINAVLGPIVTVEPPAVAGAAAAALVAAAVSWGIASTEPVAGSPVWWWWVEVATVPATLAALFVGSPFAGPVEALLWVATTASAVAVGVLTARKAAVLTPKHRLLALVACIAVVGAAAVVVGINA